MKQISINPVQLTVDEVWEYYQNIRDVLNQEYEKDKDVDLRSPDALPSKFFGMNVQEIEEFFQKNLVEADQQACLFLIAAAEAAFRVDFLQRVYHKEEDQVSQLFRIIYEKKSDDKKRNVHMDTDILDVWAKEVPDSKFDIGDFKGALKYRHWLAHGRLLGPPRKKIRSGRYPEHN